jgi:T5SS/PEP-CTERM-associated repeat protein
MFRPLVLLVLLFPVQAAATTLSWKAAVSGSAGTAANWNPAQVPTSADTAAFNVAGAYTVTWNGVPTTLSQAYRQGTVTWTSNGAHTIGTSLRVAALAGENATLSVAVGAITATSAFSVGGAAGSTGVLNVTGPAASITTPNTSDIIVGALGTGSLNLTNGGQVSVANFSQFGSGASGTGNLLVSGISATAVRSRFSSGFPAPAALSFGGSGHATATIDNGGIVEATNRVVIAATSGAVGSVVVQNASGATPSEFNVTGTLDIGFGAGAVVPGTGSLEVKNGGKATISGLTTVGDADGGTGTLHVGSLGTFTSGGLVFNDAHGVLDFTGGTIETSGGVFDPPGTTFDLAGNSRTVRLLSGGSASFSNAPLNAYALIVGETGIATFDVLGGSTLLTNATTAVGLNAAAEGTMRVENPNSTWGNSAASQLVLGVTGTGNLSVANGGHVTSDILTAGFAPGSHAFIDVAGADSRIDGTSMTFGGSGTTPGGTTNVTVTSGGTIRSDGDAFAIRILQPATVNVDAGSRLEAPFGEIENRGRILMGGGTIEAQSFTLGAGALLSGNGTVHGVIQATDSTATINTGGTLELGDSTLNNAFSTTGVFKLGTGSVRVLSRTATSLVKCGMEGARLQCFPGGAVIPAARTLNGSGTLAGRFVNGGTINAVSNGFVVLDTLLSTSGILSGTRFTFGPASLFQGFGAINADALTLQSGSTVQTTGSLVLGKNAATTSVTLLGRLFAATGATVTVNHLVSTAPCALGTLTQLNSGSHLNRTNGFLLDPGDSLTGGGTIQGPLTSNGVVSPGSDIASNTRFATLNVSGNFTQNAGGKVTVQIGDAPTNLFDKLAITGVASLGGTLDIRLPEGFAPSPGEQFTVMTYASHTGIPTVTFQGYPPGSAVTVTISPTSIVVTANTIPVGVPDPAPPLALAFAGASGEHAAFTLALPEAARVHIALYSAAGRKVGVLWDGDLAAGTRRFPLERGPGVWFARAEVVTPHGRDIRNARVTALR